MNRVKKDPSLIRHIKDPSEKIMLAAVKQDGMLLKYIETPTRKVIKAAIYQNEEALKYVKDPDEDIKLFAAHVGAFNVILPLLRLNMEKNEKSGQDGRETQNVHDRRTKTVGRA